MLGLVAERVCQPTGRAPQARSIAATVRAIAARSSSSAMPAWLSQRQPCADTSWPRRTASAASDGVRSTARPQALTVQGTPNDWSTRMIRHQPARVP